FHALGARPALDTRTLTALTTYKGTPPASIPYAQHDYQRARQLEQAATPATDDGNALPDVPGPKGAIDPATGDARPPAGAPAPVKAMIAAGNRINTLPYRYGGGHPDYLHDHALDCSSASAYLLHAAQLFTSTSA